MAMLPFTKKSTPQLSRRVAAVLIAVTVCAVAVPTVYLSDAPQANADETSPAAPAPVASESATYVDGETAVEFLPAPSPQEKRIMVLLDTPRDWNLSHQSFDGLVKAVGDEARVTIFNVAEIGNDTSDRILYGISLRALLRLLDLDHAIRDGVLFIDRNRDVAEAEADAFTRTYPVADLLPPREQNETLQSPKAFYESLLTLQETLTATIDTKSWKENGGFATISIVPTSACLVITQTPSGHEHVLTLLRSLRAAKRIAMDRKSPAGHRY
jgi:hypothetical protein